MTAKIILALVSLVLVVAVGCSVSSGEPGGTEPEIMPEGGDSAPPANMPPTGLPVENTGEIPQALFDSVVDDMLARSGGDRSAVEVLKSEAVVWPDGSLGCPQPGMMYTQAIVSGYHLVLALGDETYDYRLSERGTVVLCQNPAPGVPGETVTE